MRTFTLSGLAAAARTAKTSFKVIAADGILSVKAMEGAPLDSTPEALTAYLNARETVKGDVKAPDCGPVQKRKTTYTVSGSYLASFVPTANPTPDASAALAAALAEFSAAATAPAAPAAPVQREDAPAEQPTAADTGATATDDTTADAVKPTRQPRGGRQLRGGLNSTPSVNGAH